MLVSVNMGPVLKLVRGKPEHKDHTKESSSPSCCKISQRHVPASGPLRFATVAVLCLWRVLFEKYFFFCIKIASSAGLFFFFLSIVARGDQQVGEDQQLVVGELLLVLLPVVVMGASEVGQSLLHGHLQHERLVDTELKAKVERK